MRLAFSAFIAFLASSAFSGAPVHAETLQEAAAALLPVLDKNPDLAAAHKACPADIYRKHATLFSLLGTEGGPGLDECAADVRFCHASCVDGKNGQSCFSLARLLQDHGAPALDRHWEGLFALSCAAGRPGGCTNRAAGIRNGAYAGDPAADWSEEIRGLCLRRSFKAACDGEDAWGCAMYGQALYDGEGGPEDLPAAMAAFRKSCSIAPDFDSCGFSQEFIDVMNKAIGVK